jgi:apolipoprotein N-acyltransferase
MASTASLEAVSGNPRSAAAIPAPSHLPWYRTTLAWALCGSVLMYAALPPLDLWPLAWIAPVPWLLLVRNRELVGRRPYRAIWLAGFVFWLGVLHWLRLPYWATSIGWVALSFYLAFYISLFIGLTRYAVHRWRVSLIIAAPIIWTGLELAKGHVMGGFTMGSLEHTQTAWPAIIQPADLIGGYGVSGLIMLIAACLARMLPFDGRRFAVWPIVPLAATMGAVLLYGHFRLNETAALAPRTARVALIQGSIDTTVKSDRSQINTVWKDYWTLTGQAVREAAHMQPSRPLDLVVWPETMYRDLLYSFDDDFQVPPGARPKQELIADTTDSLAWIAGQCRAALLFGIDREHYHTMDKVDHYNSAQFVAADGRLLEVYDKMHPVVFGEYVPLADDFPFLYNLTPIKGGLTFGAKPVSQLIDGVRYCPNICYETAVPHLIRWQVESMAEQGAEPDVLVNVTNDGWFWGSSELALHLKCGIFRAVECRKPLLIAANTGISAWIDGNGRVIRQAPRRQDAVIIADVQTDGRHSFYLAHGDWFAGACLLACIGLAVCGIWERRKSSRGAR